MPGHARRQVRVAGDQRRAGRAARAGDRPVVGAAGLGGEPERAPHGVDLLDDREAVAAPGLLGDDRVVGRVGGVEAGGQLRPQGPHHVGPQQLALPVGREAEGEQLAEAEDVDRLPGLELEPQQLHLERPRAGRGGAGVDPVAEALEQARSSGSSASCSRSATRWMPSVRIRRSIGRAVGTGHLGDPAAGDAAVEVHLPEPVLRVAEALGEEEVLRPARPRRGAPPSGRGAPCTGPSSAVDLDRPLFLRQRPPRQPVPGGGQRRGAEPGPGRPGEQPRPRRASLRHPRHTELVPGPGGAAGKPRKGPTRAAPPAAGPLPRAFPGGPPSPSPPSAAAAPARRSRPRRAGRRASARRRRAAASRRRSRISRCSTYSASFAAGSVIQGPWPGAIRSISSACRSAQRAHVGGQRAAAGRDDGRAEAEHQVAAEADAGPR